MKRSELEALGLTKEQADAVIKINGDDIENAKLVSSAELKNIQVEVDSLKGSAGDNEALKQQIADLQKANTDAATAHESEMIKLKIDFAVEKALSGANAKNIKAVKALLDLEDAKLDKEGNVKGLAEQIEKLTTGEDTKFLFNEVQQQQTFKGFQPGASAQQKPSGEVDPAKMNYDELCEYLAQNPDAQLGE